MVDIRREALDEYLKQGPSKDQYRETSMVIAMPTRGMVHWKVWRSWDEIRWPMNQWRVLIDIEGHEVGEAYNSLVNKALNFSDGRPGGIRFLLTREDDNLPERDAVVKLVDAIYTCIDCGKEIDEKRYKEAKEWFCVDGHKGLDIVSGLYFGKADPPVPFVFGDPAVDNMNMTTRNCVEDIKAGRVIEVNGVPQGLCLFRLSLFNEITPPFFKTLTGQNGMYTLTQDMFFSKKAKAADLRMAVHCGALVGHIDTQSGRIY